jgi:FAD/FMN-containing dehydrogenase
MELDRRHFLGLAAFAGLGAAGTTVAGTTLAGAARAASGVDWAALEGALDGPLLRSGDRGYITHSRPYNEALGTRHPAAVARVATFKDVRTCITKVAGHGVRIAARSGGHSYPGFSTPNDGLVIDLAALNSVSVKSNGTVVVGAGARLIDVYAGLAAHGRALPAGSCPTVGIGGSTLGGGIGVLSRAYGLTSDHLRAATVVTADGDQHTVDANHSSDLFWALRGGGGGNGGVVTNFTFTTVPAPRVTTFSLSFAAGRTARVLRAWASWVHAAPHRLSAVCHVTAAATPTNRIVGTWTGSASGLSSALADLAHAVGADPTSRTVKTRTFLDAMRYFAGCSRITVEQCHPETDPGGTLGREAFRAGSRILEHSLSLTTAGKIVDLMSAQRGLVLLFDSLGGEVAALGAADTAFPHRSAWGSVQIYSGSAGSAPVVAAVQTALAPLVGSGAYVNYVNLDLGDWGAAYYGTNLARLKRVIRAYDPTGVFRFQRSVLRA